MNVKELIELLSHDSVIKTDDVFIQRYMYQSPIMKVVKVRYDYMSDGRNIIVIEGKEL